MTLAEYLAELVKLRRIDPVLADAWFDALTAALMGLFEAESSTERTGVRS